MKKIWQSVISIVVHLLTLRWIRDIWMYILRILQRMEHNSLFLSAAAIAFNALLCFIPLVLILFYILGLYLDSDTALQTIDSYIDSLELFPFQKEQLREIVLSVVGEVIGGSYLAGIIGLVGLGWTASALFSTLRNILNRIFHVKDPKGVLMSKLKDLAMLSILGIVMIVMTIALHGITFVQGIGSEYLGKTFDHWLFQDVFAYGSSILLNIILFAIIFVVIPDRKLRMKVVLLSSGVGATLWVVSKVVFGYYFTHLWKIGSIYGPYAIIAAVAIWVYYSSITLLISAEIGELYSERRYLKRLFHKEELQEAVGAVRDRELDLGETVRALSGAEARSRSSKADS